MRSKSSQKVALLEEKIGIVFQNKNYLLQALTHRSLRRIEPDIEHNERLEYLGDAALSFIVAQYLYRNYPDKKEGWLTQTRSGLVNNRSLAELAEELELIDSLLLEKGQRQQLAKGARLRVRISASMIEALIGAIYLDRGLGVAEIFVLEYLIPKIQRIVARLKENDPIGFLQAIAQDVYGITPTYKVLGSRGPVHNRTFDVGVYIKQGRIGKGTGRNKKEGRRAAAEDALRLFQ